jgi:hypothetical protein
LKNLRRRAALTGVNDLLPILRRFDKSLISIVLAAAQSFVGEKEKRAVFAAVKDRTAFAEI